MVNFITLLIEEEKELEIFLV